MKPLLVLFLTLASAFAQTDIATRLQNLNVTVHSESGQGSGTIITRSGVNLAITAAHVCEANRTVVPVLDDGKVRYESKFTVLKVTKEIYVDGRSVGTTTVEADVIAFSSSEFGHDLALLKFRSPITTESVEFCSEHIVPVGTDIMHVGSFRGQEGSSSFSASARSPRSAACCLIACSTRAALPRFPVQAAAACS